MTNISKIMSDHDKKQKRGFCQSDIHKICGWYMTVLVNIEYAKVMGVCMKICYTNGISPKGLQICLTNFFAVFLRCRSIVVINIFNNICCLFLFALIKFPYYHFVPVQGINS